MIEFQICPRQSGKTALMKAIKHPYRTYEEQKRLREKYLKGKGIDYDIPGSERHE